ncbi:MAG: hypothetical protein GY754_10810 [bacterium]|nr:hypothetical protein [bacterium]
MKKVSKKTAFKAVIVLCIALALPFFLSSCKKQVKDPENGGTGDTTSVEPVKGDDTLDKEYLKEGFMSSSTFRVVIIANKDECEEDEDEIEEKAKKRAFSTLRKYLISNKGRLGRNASAKITNMINDKGSMEKQGDTCKEKNNIFYFDVKKSNIKKHLDKISNSGILFNQFTMHN